VVEKFSGFAGIGNWVVGPTAEKGGKELNAE
jgi:hypothetical protein